MRAETDAGAATLELVALTLVVLLPVIYLVVALARVQAGAYAAEAGAYTAARAAVVAGLDRTDAGDGTGAARAAATEAALAAVRVTVEDFGLEPDSATVALDCAGPCLDPGTTVQAQVELTVALPGVPDAILARVPLAVTLTAVASSPVDGYLP